MSKSSSLSGQERLANESLGRLLFSLAIPAIIAQLVSLLYNIVDRIYIGKMADGTLAMSAVSITLPVITLITAVTMLLGSGGAPLAAIKLGQNDLDGAEKIMTASFVSLIASGLVLTVCILTFSIPLLTLFGADETSLSMAAEYISVYSLGTIFVMISIGMNPYINTQGFASTGMMTVLIGAVLNILLDPVFIFSLNMGIKGAALATVLSQFVSACWCLLFLFSRKSTIKIRKDYLIPEWSVLAAICALGISPFIMSATESLLQISFNHQLAACGGMLAVGCLSILMSLFQVVSLPLQGLTQGAQPILSYNYGAGNLKRVRDAFKLLLVCCLGVSILGYGSIILFSRFFASIFTSDPELISLAAWALKIYLAGAVIFGAQIACQQSFVALGQAVRSLAMALFRKIILLIPLIYILPGVIGSSRFAWDLAAPVQSILIHPGNATAIFLAESISDFLAALTTSTLFYFFYKKDLKN